MKMITFKELSTPLKIAVIMAWCVGVVYILSFLIGFIIGFTAAY